MVYTCIYPYLPKFSMFQLRSKNNSREAITAAKFGMPLLKTDMQPCIRWDRNVVFPWESYPALLNPPNTSSTTPGPAAPNSPSLGPWTKKFNLRLARMIRPSLMGYIRLRTGSCATWVSALLRTTILRPPLSPESAPLGNPGCHQQLPSWDGINPKTKLADDGRTTTCLGAKVEQFVLGNGLGQKPKEMENVGT